MRLSANRLVIYPTVGELHWNAGVFLKCIVVAVRVESYMVDCIFVVRMYGSILLHITMSWVFVGRSCELDSVGVNQGR